MVHSQPKRKQIKLFPYQQMGFEKLVTALKTTFRALLVMATGLGKTFLSIEVVKYFITPKDKVLFLCHDNGILNKSYKDYKKFIGNQYTYAKFYGDEKDWEADKHHFVFATFQSLRAHLENKNARKKLFSPNHFSFVVVDESHHSQAETFAEVINYFTPTYKLGMTATPDREDHADIRDIFGEEVVDIRLPEAIAKNWLTKIDYKVLSDGLDEKKIREICKEVLEDNVRLTEKQINERVFIKVRTEEQCKIVQEYSKTQKAIVFCENLEHLRHVASILPSSVTIHSEQSAKLNDANFALFEHGHVQHVIVVNKFNEGIDVPDTGLLVFLRVTDCERIFLQQLGRGLRKMEGKEKVTVLDFVANIERIKRIIKLTMEIERFNDTSTEEKREYTTDGAFHVEGKGFRFDFSNQIVDLLSVFERLDKDFYPTWQEASEAAIALGIESLAQYRKHYAEDPRLPSNPHKKYPDFPRFEIFLGKEGKDLYPTWQEASEAAIALGIENSIQYKERYAEDSRLPSFLSSKYPDFPGFEIFFGKEKKEFYPTWQEASEAAIALGIENCVQYAKHYRNDSRLPSTPKRKYLDFPGFEIFFGKEKKVRKTRINLYPTWQEASEAAIALGIENSIQYKERYAEDSRLPSSPNRKYPDFPGFEIFFGKEKKEFYPTWQEASEAAIALGIETQRKYHGLYVQDPRLPSVPNKKYPDFPGFEIFLGKK